MQTLLNSVDLYCERLDGGYWAEPVNALTNLFFVAAGLWGFLLIRRGNGGRWAILMAWWVCAIGVGSWLFHTHANRLTMWADIVPIGGFTIAYILYNLRIFMGFSWPRSLIHFTAFTVVIGAVTASLPSWLHELTNGSSAYLPPFAALIYFGLFAVVSGKPVGWFNVAAGCLFAVSLTFRSIDMNICDALPLGTHFMWHTLSAAMLAIILLAIARYSRSTASRTAR